MCLNPKHGTTRARYINASTLGAQIYNTYNCGKCAECLQMKQTEYSLRSQAQYKATLEQNGFCYWDTLTYDQQNVPVYTPTGLTRGFNSHAHYDKRGKLVLNNDCLLTFNPADYRNFLKRLRVNLTRSGYDVKDNLKYFFVSEYGGQTKRPHYHFIFYITIPNITSDIIEQFVKKSWNLGRIDVEKKASQKVIDGLGAINYVAKYVSKDDVYIKELERYCKLNKIDKEIQKKVLQPFHKQSQGFGIDIISQQDQAFMDKTGKMQVWDKQGYKEVDIPLYIKRKLYYENYRDSEGNLHWRLNERGRQIYIDLLPTKINKMVDRYQEAYDNVYKFVPKDEYSFDIKHLITRHLNGRTFKDLALYQLIYQGRLLPAYTRKTLPSPTEMINGSFDNADTDLSELNDLLTVHPDLGKAINLSEFYRRVDGGFEDFTGKFISYDQFLDTYLINEHSFIEFSGFDFILSLLSITTRAISEEKEKKYINRQNIKSRLRTLQNKYQF